MKGRIGSYNAILEVEFLDDGTISHFLSNTSDDELTAQDLECDLQSDLWFNEFSENEIKKTFIKEINCLDDVINFMKEHNYQYKKYYHDNILKIGGEHDMNLYSDLSYEWEEI